MVDISIANCSFTRPGKPPFSIIFLWFSCGFPMVFLWFSYGFPMVFLWFSYGFPMVFHHFPMVNHHVQPLHLPTCGLQAHLLTNSAAACGAVSFRAWPDGGPGGPRGDRLLEGWEFDMSMDSTMELQICKFDDVFRCFVKTTTYRQRR